MPENIFDLVKVQHDPSLSTEPKTASLVHIASRTASQLEHNKLSGFDFSQTIQPVAWLTTNLDQESVHTAISIADVNCQAMLSAMTGKQMQVA